MGASRASAADYPTTVLEDHPVSYWRLNDPSGTTAADQTGNDPGQISPGVTLGQPGPFTGSGAMDFDGGNCTGIGLDANGASLAPPHVAVEAWIKTTTTGTMVFRHRAYGYELVVGSGGLASFGVSDGGATGTTNVADGRWHYLEGGADGSMATLYVDGRLEGSAPASGDLYYQRNEVAIGRDADACDGVNPSFVGAISEVAVYNYALSAAQVAAHYQAASGGTAGSGRFVDPTPSDRSLFDAREAGCCSFTLATDSPSQTIRVIYGLHSNGMQCETPSASPGSAPVTNRVTCTVSRRDYAPFEAVRFDAVNPDGSVTDSRTYSVGTGVFVAMGDSYQSGEGARTYDSKTTYAPSGQPPYLPGTDTPENQCHRSSDAYSQILVREVIPGPQNFVACSGARIRDVVGGSTGPSNDTPGSANESPQIRYLDNQVSLITLGVGGNDIGFASIVTQCVANNPLSSLVGVNGCIDQDKSVARTIQATAQRLSSAYLQIRSVAPRARIIVVDYPRPFEPVGDGGSQCNHLDHQDQAWLNSVADRLDDTIVRAASASGVEVVDVRHAFAGHDPCRKNDPYLNGLLFHKGGYSKAPESVHPNAAGQRATERIIARYLSDHPRAPVADAALVHPGETAYENQPVGAGSLDATFNASWPGSRIDLTVVSPHGHKYSAAAPPKGATGTVGPTYATISIHRPEPGTWKIALHGTSVSVHGETVQVHTSIAPLRRPGALRVARDARVRHSTVVLAVACRGATDGCAGSLTLTARAGHRTVRVGAGGSFVPNGRRGGLNLRLNARTRGALRSRHLLPASLTITLDDPQGSAPHRARLRLRLHR